MYIVYATGLKHYLHSGSITLFSMTESLLSLAAILDISAIKLLSSYPSSSVPRSDVHAVLLLCSESILSVVQMYFSVFCVPTKSF